MKNTSLIILFLLSAQPVMACDTSAGWQMMKSANATNIKVAVKLPESPIPTSEPFDVDVMICDPISFAPQVEIDANMPAHQHGMNYIPDVSRTAEKTYQASGLFFHMPGQWQVTVDLKGEYPLRFYLDVEAQ